LPRYFEQQRIYVFELNFRNLWIMKTILIIGGLLLLLLAAVGVICWVWSFGMFREMMVDGVPVFFSHGGSQTQIPGRLVVVLVIAIPITCAIGGSWLLRSAFGGDDKPGA